MRRVGLSLFGCMALVAFMGLSAPAFATHDPHCDQYNNEVGIFEFQVDTPDSHKEHAVSGVTGSAYACGSDLTLFGGDGTLYNHADVGVPPGVTIADSDLVPNGSHAATAEVNVLYRAGMPFFTRGVASEVTTDNKTECTRERDNEVVGNTPQGTIVSCLYGENPLGHNWNWATLDQNGKLWLTIGPMHTDIGVEPGLTYVDLNLCDYYGAVGGTQCGDPGDQFVQKNGDATHPSSGFMGWCESQYQWNENGIYTVTATMENGTVTPEASATVEWVHTPCSSSKRSK